MPEFYNLDNFKRGWFVGNFSPAILRTEGFEVAVIRHPANDLTTPHFHTASEEINLVVQGSLVVNGRVLKENDIFVYQRNEVSDVHFKTDSTLVVVRVPSSPDDKVIVS
jgi:hypothetical protein